MIPALVLVPGRATSELLERRGGNQGNGGNRARPDEVARTNPGQGAAASTASTQTP